MSKKNLNYKIVQRRDVDVPKLYANANLAEEKLNWNAECDLKEMIASAWKWEMRVRE